MTKSSHSFVVKPSHSGNSLPIWTRIRAIFIVTLFVGLLVWLIAPGSKGDDQLLPVGRIQRIQFFWAMGTDTQVDTQSNEGLERSFAVNGVSRLHKGQEVLLRLGRFHSEICTPDLTLCEALKGNPK